MSNLQKGAIDLKERTTVYATASHPNVKEGTKMEMGVVAADFAVTNGYATKEAPGKKAKA